MEKQKIKGLADEEIIQLASEPGYETLFNLHFDRKYRIGNTTGYIAAPRISREENERRWQCLNETASKIVKEMVARGVFSQDTKGAEER